MFTTETIREFVRAPMPAARRAPSRLRFSIVMPSFRHAPFIERSLNSVLNQEYEATELIVMDGGSDDGTREILERYSPHIAVWRSEQDAGQSDALNKGFAHVSGDILGWLNSDDLYLPGAMHHAAHVFAAYPQIDVVYGDWLTVDLTDRIVDRWPALAPSRGRLVTEGFFCNAQAMFWRRSLHERLGEFDRQLHYTMDYDLMLRMISTAGEKAFFRTERPLGCFRINPGQKTGRPGSPVPEEHRRIAAQQGTAWKYTLSGQMMRAFYRVTRCTEILARGRPDYLLSRLKRHLAFTGANEAS